MWTNAYVAIKGAPLRQQFGPFVAQAMCRARAQSPHKQDRYKHHVESYAALLTPPRAHVLVAPAKPNKMSARPSSELGSRRSPSTPTPRNSPTMGMRNVTIEVLAAPAEWMSRNQMMNASAVLSSASPPTAATERPLGRNVQGCSRS